MYLKKRSIMGFPARPLGTCLWFLMRTGHQLNTLLPACLGTSLFLPACLPVFLSVCLFECLHASPRVCMFGCLVILFICFVYLPHSICVWCVCVSDWKQKKSIRPSSAARTKERRRLVYKRLLCVPFYILSKSLRHQHPFFVPPPTDIGFKGSTSMVFHAPKVGAQ